MKTPTTPKPACDRAEDLVTYLYGEATPDQSHSFERHMTECAVCRDEFAAFSSVRNVMPAWELTTVPRIEVAIKPTFIQACREFFGSLSPWGRMALAGAAGLVVMSLLNVHIGIGSNGFSVSLGGTPPQTVAAVPSPVPARVTRPTMEAVNVKALDEAAIRTLVAQLVRESETRQDEKLAAQLRTVSAQLSSQHDAQLIKAISSLKRDQLRQVMAIIQENDRRSAPDLLDLFSATSAENGGTMQQ